MRRQLSIAATLLCLLLLTSCVTRRDQWIRSPRPVWMSKSGDDASLGKLTLLGDGKATPGPDSRFVQLEPKVRIFITDDTKKHGGDVFIKIQVQDGSHAGSEGWVCRNSKTVRKIWAWHAL